jgi:hypothetical protein
MTDAKNLIKRIESILQEIDDGPKTNGELYSLLEDCRNYVEDFPATEGDVVISRECAEYCLGMCEKTNEQLSIVSVDEVYMKKLATVINELRKAQGESP